MCPIQRNGENQKNDWISLGKFQKGQGIHPAQQIVLLNNRQALKKYCSVITPSKFRDAIRTQLRRPSLRFFDQNEQLKVAIPSNCENLFLGYFDKSLDKINDPLDMLFQLMRDAPTRSFTLLVGKGDYEIGPGLVNLLPPNLDTLTANNVNVNHHKIRYLPMGRDFRNGRALRKVPPNSSKSTLVYCNYSVNTHPVRKKIYSYLLGLDFVKFEHMGNFLDYSISRKQFQSSLAEAKFSVCPRGNAIDTFRLWDSLYLGTIPIVVKEAVFHEKLKDLPILFLDDISSFGKLNSSWLEDKYREYQEKRFNYAKLQMRYWLKKSGDISEQS